jgi:Ca-activated chloride channel family protein
MKRTVITAMLVLALLLPLAAKQAQQERAHQERPASPAQQPAQKEQEPAIKLGEQGTVRVNVNLVDVLFTVLNRRNKLVTDLTKEDFRVIDDGQPQQIRYFSRQTDLPLRVGVLMDTSNSIRDRLQFEKEAATEFLFNVLRRGRDQAFLMTFDDEPSVVQDYTDDPSKLRDQIYRQRAGGGTAVYDAIFGACANQLSHPPRPEGDNPDVVRRVMILISDGDDNLSAHSRGEAIEMAQRASVVIYTISTSTQWATTNEDEDASKRADRKYHKTEGDKILADLAEETGGRAFFPYRVYDLDQSFQDIGDELRSQYSLAYNPTNYEPNGKYHKVHIDVIRTKGVQVHARRGYYARTSVRVPKPAGN